MNELEVLDHETINPADTYAMRTVEVMSQWGNGEIYDKLLKVFKTLQGHTLYGLSNKDIADIVGTTPVNVVRDLDDLIAEGLVERTHDGRFRYGIQVIKISRAHENEFKKMRTHLDEVEQRIGRGSQL